MKVQSTFLALATALVTISAACSSNPTGSSGAGGSSSTGTGGTGGGSSGGKGGSSSGGTSGGSSCQNVTACGGNVVGTWTVGSSCLTLNDDNLDITLAGLD